MAQFTKETSTTGAFVRQPNRFTARPEPEPGRYRLVVSLACPWAHRAVIVRKLLKLEDAISLRPCRCSRAPATGASGWAV